MVHTVIRIPAGAALAAGVFGGDQPTWAAVAALLGGTLAATAHAAKATTRAAVNTSPEPFSNIGVSLAEDGIVPARCGWRSSIRCGSSSRSLSPGRDGRADRRAAASFLKTASCSACDRRFASERV